MTIKERADRVVGVDDWLGSDQGKLDLIAKIERAITAAVEAEREACAQIAKDAAAKDARHSDSLEITGLTSEGMRAWEIYRMIRARSEVKK